MMNKCIETFFVVFFLNFTLNNLSLLFTNKPLNPYLLCPMPFQYACVTHYVALELLYPCG